jgi:hypothetical protein
MSASSYTLRLFKKRPSFFGGFSSILDFSDTKEKFNYSKTDALADCESIQADWMSIGEDMKTAISEYARESEYK